MPKLPILAPALASILALGACNGAPGIPGPTAAAALPPEAAAPVQVAERQGGGGEAKGCAPAIARTRALVESDVATENLAERVGQRFTADLEAAGRACAAGREAEGLRLLAAAKGRYGYR